MSLPSEATESGAGLLDQQVSAGRLLELLSILGVELVLRQDSASPSAASPETSVPPRPAW